ncbi:MAG: hypothetical protein LBJ21_04890 [Acidobacteriota bacterium]|jgi:DNA-directed RNA polymerase subunit RPC12/RpoP|nr:hypothetical protein [Acidobacteriota bacterium]
MPPETSGICENAQRESIRMNAITAMMIGCLVLVIPVALDVFPLKINKRERIIVVISWVVSFIAVGVLPEVFPAMPLYIYIGLMPVYVTILSVLIIVSYHKKMPCYICPNCHAKFKPTFRSSLSSTKAGSKLLVKCPECGKKKYMNEALEDESAAPLGNS